MRKCLLLTRYDYCVWKIKYNNFLCRYYEDKSVYKLYKKGQAYLAKKDYVPGEERTINLNDEYWDRQWYLNNNDQPGKVAFKIMDSLNSQVG